MNTFRSSSFTVLALFLSGITHAIESGHSAIWYDPDRVGEGWVLEILEDDRAAAYWYTYDENGDQRWLIGAGQILEGAEGRFIEFPELLIASGGRFGDQFDPDDVVLEDVGNATFRFEDCDNGVVEFDALGVSGSTPVVRLTNTMGAGCWPLNGVPGQPVQPFAGESGSWFDVTHTGEGFTLYWLANGRVAAYWFSYDTQGNQAWMLGVGELVGDEILFPEMLQTRGARYGDLFNPEDVELFPWGEMSIILSCDGGEVTYESVIPEFGEGGQSLVRLTNLSQIECPYQKPLITDLYDFSWNEIPIDRDTAYQSGTSALRLADDGSVVGSTGFSAEGVTLGSIWKPETGEWELLDDQAIEGAEQLWISPDGSSVLANEDVEPNAAQTPVKWNAALGWANIENTLFFENFATGASDDLNLVVGVGSAENEPGSFPWVWTAEDGALDLPETETIRGARPLDSSFDGSRIIGYALRRGASPVTPDSFGIMWENFGDPVTFTDEIGTELAIARTCNTDCGVIAGSGQTVYSPDHPNAGQAWYWTESGFGGYMGVLADGVDTGRAWSYVPTDVSNDGSLFIGTYATAESGTTDQLSTRSFLWTEATGIVSILNVALELGIGDDNWNNLIAYSITSDGLKILLSGSERQALNQRTQRRAVVLELTPKLK